MKINLHPVKLSLICLAVVTVVSCKKEQDKTAIENTVNDSIASTREVELKPVGPAPKWAPNIEPEMAVVIEKLESLGGKPIEKLSAKEARRQPTPTDAVKAVMKQHTIQMPVALCDTVGKDIQVTGGQTHIRIYTPKTGKAPFPIVVYYHGGGFVIANLEVYTGGAQGLCELTGAIVVSVEYPKGPEHKFPAAHNVAFDAYQWVLKNANSIKGDSKKVAVAGESAGGNLAANVSLMARDKKILVPLYAVLIYPVANNDMTNESYTKYAMAKPLNKAMMGWFVKNYLSSEAQSADPRISIVKANLKDFPPTLIIAAEIDPLMSEGKLLADKLLAANVETDYELYNGVTHEFFGMAALIPQAKSAQKMAAGKLKEALGLN